MIVQLRITLKEGMWRQTTFKQGQVMLPSPLLSVSWFIYFFVSFCKFSLCLLSVAHSNRGMHVFASGLTRRLGCLELLKPGLHWQGLFKHTACSSVIALTPFSHRASLTSESTLTPFLKNITRDHTWSTVISVRVSPSFCSVSSPGLGFTWRGGSGAALKPERYRPHPSGRHSLCLFRLVLSPSPLPNMLCWGNAKDGQLGIGLERNPLFEPKNCHVFIGRGLKDVSCGGQYSMFLLYDGSVYTCGSNSCGQLGHDKPGTAPGKL